MGQRKLYLYPLRPSRQKTELHRRMHKCFLLRSRTHKVIPGEFTTAYESIVLRCTAHHSLHEAERMSALSLFLSKYCPNDKIKGLEYAQKSFHRTEIIRLDIEEISAKSKNRF